MSDEKPFHLHVTPMGMGGTSRRCEESACTPTGTADGRPVDEKPLHVRVAEALGCKPEAYRAYNFSKVDSWRCTCPQVHLAWPHGWGDSDTIRPYDTQWQYGGPLIEKYRISVNATVKLLDGEPNIPLPGDGWIAADERLKRTRGPWVADGPTPLIAVCNLILSLHAAGKLEAK